MTGMNVAAEIHGFSEPGSTPTSWVVGLEQLRERDTYWLSTVRPYGRPHVTPLIAVWHVEALWFATGPEERKTKNLAENPSCVLTTGCSDLADGALDLMIEGRAEQVTDDAELEQIATRFATSTRPVRGTSLCVMGHLATEMAVGAYLCSGCARYEAWGSAKAITSARQPGTVSDETS